MRVPILWPVFLAHFLRRHQVLAAITSLKDIVDFDCSEKHVDILLQGYTRNKVVDHEHSIGLMQQHCRQSSFIETGTNKGRTTLAMLNSGLFDNVFSVEYSTAIFELNNRTTFADTDPSQLHLYQGDSGA